MVAKGFIRMLLTMDRYMMGSEDQCTAWVAIAIALRLTSVRDLSLAEISAQLGVTPEKLSRKTAQFRRMAGVTAERPYGGGRRPEKTVPRLLKATPSRHRPEMGYERVVESGN